MKLLEIFKSTLKHISRSAKRSRALDYVSNVVSYVGSNTTRDLDLYFALSSRTSQLGEARTNEIKHGIYPE